LTALGYELGRPFARHGLRLSGWRLTSVAKNDYYARMHIESPTQTIARLHRTRRGASVAVTAVACVVLASACGSSSSKPKNLETARVAASIEQSILTKRHIHATVVCPATVPQEQGRTFVCIATSKSTKAPFPVIKTPFRVTIQTSRGYVTYVGQ
jgi:hypothetical protein